MSFLEASSVVKSSLELGQERERRSFDKIFRLSSIRLLSLDGLSSFCCPLVGIKTRLRCKLLSQTIQFIVSEQFCSFDCKDWIKLGPWKCLSLD